MERTENTREKRRENDRERCKGIDGEARETNGTRGQVVRQKKRQGRGDEARKAGQVHTTTILLLLQLYVYIGPAVFKKLVIPFVVSASLIGIIHSSFCILFSGSFLLHTLFSLSLPFNSSFSYPAFCGVRPYPHEKTLI